MSTSTSSTVQTGRSRRALRLAFLVALCISRSAAAQDTGQPLKKFRALLTTGQRIEGTNGSLTAAVLRGRLSAGHDTTVSKSDLRSLDVAAGSEVLKGAAIGGGLGLLTGLSAYSSALQAQENGISTVNQSRVVPVVVGVTAAAALIGAVVGAHYDRWQHISLTASPPVSGGGRMGLAFQFGIPTL